jgi:S-adenosylmethionine hydrolase
MIITLTTDFGASSPYVAAMKGVILSIAPSVTLVDVSHEVPPQDVRAGAILLAEVIPWFPAGTIHLAVVDPGVGTARRLVALAAGRQRFVGPDNGLFSRVAALARPEQIVSLENPRYRLEPTSATFHGRDILAPAAAHLARGLDLAELGPPLDALVTLAWPEPRVAGERIAGQIEWVDKFGNLITNLRAAHLETAAPGRWRIECGGAEIGGLVRTYGDRPAGELVALIGSGGRLEVAVVQGSAAQRLRLGAGAPVVAQRVP